jgi:hypothetical protein
MYFCHEGGEMNFETHAVARFASSLPAGRHLWLVDPPAGLDAVVNSVQL